MVLKEFEKLNQEPKGCFWHEEKTKVIYFNAVFCHLFELNFGHCQLLPPGRCEEEHEKYFLFVKNGISIKNIFWVILCPKMTSFLNSGCIISIWAYYLCKFGSSRCYQKYFGASFIFMKNLPGKMFLSSGAILYRLASIFIDSSASSCDYNSSLWYS